MRLVRLVRTILDKKSPPGSFLSLFSPYIRLLQLNGGLQRTDRDALFCKRTPAQSSAGSGKPGTWHALAIIEMADCGRKRLSNRR